MDMLMSDIEKHFSAGFPGMTREHLYLKCDPATRIEENRIK
jgi:hypothetical protein